jgi:methionyl-tRNA synthetase
MQDLKLPDKIISHGWIITKTGKMSKSLGNVIDPNIYVEKYGSDALRYFLISQTSYERDSIFSYELFINTINSHLANNYGNLFSRISTMIFKYCHGLVPKLNEKTLNDLDKKILKERANIINKYKILIENFDITGLVNLLQSQYSNINKYIDTTQP